MKIGWKLWEWMPEVLSGHSFLNCYKSKIKLTVIFNLNPTLFNLFSAGE